MSVQSLHKLMQLPLFLVQCGGCFPVSGVYVKTSHKLKFRWFSWHFLFSLGVLTALILTLFKHWESFQEGSVYYYKDTLLRVGTPDVIVFPLLLQISYKWRNFVRKWEFIENNLSNYGCLPNVALHVKLIIFVFVAGRVGYIFMNMLVIVIMGYDCFPSASLPQQLNTYFSYRYRLYPDGTLWQCSGLLLIDLVINLQWTSSSILITSLSVILIARFKVFNKRLDAYKLQLMSPSYWREMRDYYNSLAQLTMLLDDLIGPLILFSFTLDSLNIIIFIYESIIYVKEPIIYVLAVIGFFRVILVAFITQIAVCRVYEESKRPLEMFGLVPSLSYCKESERLYEQVTNDILALTGCQFFYVTRSVILTMVSTIVTYEVVLIQFGNYEETTSTNQTYSYCRIFNKNYENIGEESPL